MNGNLVTHGVQYMGSKSKLVNYIANIAGNAGAKTALDIFTGSSRVAQALRQRGVEVTTLDLSPASRNYSAVFIQQSSYDHLKPHLEIMNSLEGVSGWITENYSGGEDWDKPTGFQRYIHPKNAKRADAARDYVETLDIPKKDKEALVGCIILSLNKVDNGMGHQQAYLKQWSEKSQKDIVFEFPPIIKGPVGHHIHGNCFEIEYPQADFAYLDPPYSANVSYHTYYHIWDSISLWDKPKTDLVAKRRIDRVKPTKSKPNPDYDDTFDNNPFYKDAEKGFRTMMDKLSHIPNILWSYSSESAVSKERLLEVFSEYGEVKCFELDHKQHMMTSIGGSSRGSKVERGLGNLKEYLFYIKK